jgi:D-sedoheptulose 7-phosphate isomerase
MTMLLQRIQQQFFESADLKYQSAEVLSRPIQDAVAALVGGLTSGGRVLVAGLGVSASLAQLMAVQLIGRFERDRPGLAAMALGADGTTLAVLSAETSASGQAGALDQVLSRQVQTLGQPGDLLLLIDTDGQHPALLGAVAAAQGKDMTVIALTGRSGGALRQALSETDVLVAVPHDRRARVLETQLLVLHCLCDAIDQQLLGEQDTA